MHGQIQEWATGGSCVVHTLKEAICPLCITCLLEKDRKAIEVKIHGFHRERNDTRARRAPHSHEGVCAVAILCGPQIQWSFVRRTGGGDAHVPRYAAGISVRKQKKGVVLCEAG